MSEDPKKQQVNSTDRNQESDDATSQEESKPSAPGVRRIPSLPVGGNIEPSSKVTTYANSPATKPKSLRADTLGERIQEEQGRASSRSSADEFQQTQKESTATYQDHVSKVASVEEAIQAKLQQNSVRTSSNASSSQDAASSSSITPSSYRASRAARRSRTADRNLKEGARISHGSSSSGEFTLSSEVSSSGVQQEETRKSWARSSMSGELDMDPPLAAATGSNTNPRASVQSLRTPAEGYSVRASLAKSREFIPDDSSHVLAQPGAIAVGNPDLPESPDNTFEDATGDDDPITTRPDSNRDMTQPLHNPITSPNEDTQMAIPPREDVEQATTDSVPNTSDEDKTNSEAKSLRKIAIVVGLILLIGIVVGVAVALSGGKDDAPQSIPSQEPTMAPTAGLGSDALLYQSMVSDLTTDATVFDSVNSPQPKALLWLKDRYEGMDLPDNDQVRQEYALAVLYYSTGGDTSWRNQAGFLDPTDVCNWTDIDESGLSIGVRCSSGIVTGLYFDSNNLRGAIPSEIAALTDLRAISFGRNGLTGTVPSTISQFPLLEVLDLNTNSLKGAIPTSLASLTNLQILSLAVNQFRGPLSIDPLLAGPNCVLRTLELSDNRFEGDFAFSDLAQNCPLIERLSIGVSGLKVGQPFPAIGLEQMTFLDLRRTELTGALPPSISRMKLLETVRMDFNFLEKSLPTAIGSLTNLKLLDLSFNQLEGILPTTVGQLSRLEKLFLTGNFLEGPVPSELGSLSRLEEVYLGQNFFEGSLEFFCTRNPTLSVLIADCVSSDIECSCCTECS